MFERLPDPMRLRLERDVNDAVQALFQRWPALWGVAVQARSRHSEPRAASVLVGDLVLADVGAEMSLNTAQAELLFADISAELADLLGENPEAAELLRGRTFARVLH